MDTAQAAIDKDQTAGDLKVGTLLIDFRVIAVTVMIGFAALLLMPAQALGDEDMGPPRMKGTEETAKEFRSWAQTQMKGIQSDIDAVTQDIAKKAAAASDNIKAEWGQARAMAEKQQQDLSEMANSFQSAAVSEIEEQAESFQQSLDALRQQVSDLTDNVAEFEPGSQETGVPPRGVDAPGVSNAVEDDLKDRALKQKGVETGLPSSVAN